MPVSENMREVSLKNKILAFLLPLDFFQYCIQSIAFVFPVLPCIYEMQHQASDEILDGDYMHLEGNFEWFKITLWTA